jgi:hypothetical protein
MPSRRAQTGTAPGEIRATSIDPQLRKSARGLFEAARARFGDYRCRSTALEDKLMKFDSRAQTEPARVRSLIDESY